MPPPAYPPPTGYGQTEVAPWTATAPGGFASAPDVSKAVQAAAENISGASGSWNRSWGGGDDSQSSKPAIQTWGPDSWNTGWEAGKDAKKSRSRGRDREKSRSRNRDKGRSRSRDRRRSRSRGKPLAPDRPRPIDPPGRQMMYKGESSKGGGGKGSGGQMESRTIQITSGVVTTRLWLKKEMERFGRVEVCHTGNRMNPTGEPPWVRFATLNAAEVALQNINLGLVLIDGTPVTAQMKPGGGGGGRFPPRPADQPAYPRCRDVEITSRELALEARRGKKSKKSSSSSRSRSRSRRRR